MFRYLLWRTLALASALVAVGLALRLLHGSLGADLRGARRAAPALGLGALLRAAGWEAAALRVPALAAGLSLCAAGALMVAARARARARRRYVRLQVLPYRTDAAEPQAVARVYAALHASLGVRWWRRLLAGQPSVALEVHHRPRPGGGPGDACLAASVPRESAGMVEAALRAAYPNTRLLEGAPGLAAPEGVLVRLRKHRLFTLRVEGVSRFERDPEPALNRLLTVMGACGGAACVQLALTPAPAIAESLARRLYKRREARLARERRLHLIPRDRSLVEEVELRGGLEVQHSPLHFAEIRVIASSRADCGQIAAALRSRRAENRLVERGTALRHGLLGLYERRTLRGEGNPLPDLTRGVFSPAELAELWQFPSVGYAAVPLARAALPLAPAPPDVHRPGKGEGVLRDAHGPVSIHVALRRQNTAVPGTVEQGKSSYLVASVAEDLRRERCAVIVLDPKGDAAEAALSAVPPGRTCTLLDFSRPTCGFNPLAADAPADVIADYVVAALKNLFTDADIRASSDRYLRNAIIAVLAYDRACSLWDAARLLSVGEEGYAYRRAVGGKVRELPALREIAQFFTAELSAQLADARGPTTAKLDAPVNKLARLLNSPSIKRVLLNDSLRVDFDRVIAAAEVLVVKGALGAMGAGNTSVLMQLLVGMLDAALARQQDSVPAERRTAVALKIDEAPLVINRGFAETMALKRSAGLETVACWQTDSQWVDREVRDQLDALFAHRVYFATSSARDARAAAPLAMSEFSDTVRPGIANLSPLGRPDVRLRLPRHHAIASWATPQGRQAAFLAHTIPMRVDPARLAHHAEAQRLRGGRYLDDLAQPHWERRDAGEDGAPPDASTEPAGAGIAARAPAAAKVGAVPATLPDRPAESYRELVELDRAAGARCAPARHRLDGFQPEPLDIAILALLAGLGHLLSSQIHRHFNPGRAMSTTQRRLKRLADAGLVERTQFHRPDGGGVPMCYRIAPAGRWALAGAEHPAAASEPSPPAAGEQGLRRARHDLHVAGWVLALAALAEGAEPAGPAASVLVPPRSAASRPPGPEDLCLPEGRVPHEFLRTVRSGRREPAERFDTLRPDATLTIPGGRGTRSVDVLVDLDDRHASPGWAARLERYDHFLSGWCLQTARYGSRGPAEAFAVFVCRDRSRARECARRADRLLCACQAYAGEYPRQWRYPGRLRVLFAAERDAHEGLAAAWRVPDLPPDVRREAEAEDQTTRPVELSCEIPTAAIGTGG